jgi:hypothetical protein
MKRISMIGIGLILAAQLSLAQASQAPEPGQTETRFAPGTALRVELVKTIDAKKAKVGDPVIVKTSDELLAGTRVVSPRGTQIVGHVVAVTPHKGDTPSTLEIAFDKIELGAGNEVPVKASIQALSEPQYPTAADYASGGGAPGGGQAGSNPVGRSAGGYPPGGSPGGSSPNPGMGNPGNQQPGGNAPVANAQLSLDARGIVGSSNMTLGAGPQQDSLLTSQKHNVKIENGTQMILRTE